MNTALTPKKNILITGAAGQLGSSFRVLSAEYPQYNFIFTDRDALTVTNEQAVKSFFSEHIIYACINCAAYTAVDKAEQEKELAEKVNTYAVEFLAMACKAHNAKFIHISTDYVFNGKGVNPYFPEDTTDPVNFYGFTKREGEIKALTCNPQAMIIRTAWVYSSFGNNFVKTMMRLMKEKESIGVVNDQTGSPTFAGDLASAIMQIVDKNKFVPGIYHYTNKGVITWYEFAKKIAMLLHKDCIVKPISTDQFPTPAARPSYSVLDTGKITETFKIDIPEWEESLKKCMAQLQTL